MTWIPVGERLPEDETEVLCWWETECRCAVFALCKYYGEPLWVGVDTNVWPREVTHWQPLPEPPGKEGA